jgi:hypothetical protein
MFRFKKAKRAAMRLHHVFIQYQAVKYVLVMRIRLVIVSFLWCPRYTKRLGRAGDGNSDSRKKKKLSFKKVTTRDKE